MELAAIMGVDFLNASFILSENNFGIYTEGDNKDKIDVLHFNEGHTILAKFIVENLG